MSEATNTHLSGDLARLVQWWCERADNRARVVGHIDLDGLEDAANANVDFTAQVDRAIDSGASVVCIYGQPADVSMRAAIATQTGVNAASMIEQASGMSDLDWMRTVAEIRDARSAAVSDQRIESLAAALRRCSERRTPVLFDGPFAHASALYAANSDDQALSWWLPVSSSTDQAIREVQDKLELVPALDLHLDGTGDVGVRAVLALLDELVAAEAD